ncbi:MULTISPECIES: hypothetical protein [unclassified Oleiphilus]|uniref:hypothetical protein n=1 Tax=unclassified Oleiphilus TaxID=2631174 RepID=UPI0007C362A2|nr:MULTISPECIES: hypothetical protein [unclassified Oleiphilus]KZY42419.1 hypothetical protein A3732_16325 [Oleiphilus sp. HI0050]KZZ35665.1 hypothetical protein A3757_15170 [Oleiphilus sp. HI0117]KZZ37040.1 hypothetical protein A3756_11425 [Oleiphilus sp. HI0086]KZZ58073.1 hypothetical protein A3761_06375 [Oleiphilus sp. HI0123]
MGFRKSDSYEAVFFVENQQVTKHLMFSEFEAMLDGLGALPDYADQEAKAVYAVIGKDGTIQALVFFILYFDEDGKADASWNVPIERLAEVSGSGPDLGGGPIRLACRGQCSINWHLNDLWDPDMTPGSNDFLRLKKAVELNKLRFQFEKAEPDIPVLSPSDPVLDDLGLETEVEKRTKLARLLKEQRLRIRTLESSREQNVDFGDREQKIILHAYKNEIQELKQTNEQLKLINEKLKLKLGKRNDQFLKLQDQVSDQSDLVSKLETRLKGASAGDKERLERQKMEAEMVLLKEQLDRKDLDLAYREEREEQLRSELEELSESRGASSTNEGMFDRLKALDVVYVAYHPGAGHITMTASEIRDYVDNPNAFVAAKCYVTEEQYLAWLEHFDQPICQHAEGVGQVCGKSVSKVSAPGDFQEGVSDMCESHKGYAG